MRLPPATGRVRGFVALPVVVLASLALAGCTTAAPDERSTTAAPIPTGSIVPIPAPPTSYAGLGAFGKYAKALDEQHGVQPDFAQWIQSAQADCAIVENGDFESMSQPSTFNGQPDEQIADGSHPISGKIWAAALTAECPGLLTSDVRKHFEIEQRKGFEWVATVH